MAVGHDVTLICERQFCFYVILKLNCLYHVELKCLFYHFFITRYYDS